MSDWLRLSAGLALLTTIGCRPPAEVGPAPTAINYRNYSAAEMERLLISRAEFGEVRLKLTGANTFTGTATAPDGTKFDVTVTAEIQSVKYAAKNAAGVLVGTITPSDHKQELRLNP